MPKVNINDSYLPTYLDLENISNNIISVSIAFIRVVGTFVHTYMTDMTNMTDMTIQSVHDHRITIRVCSFVRSCPSKDDS